MFVKFVLVPGSFVRVHGFSTNVASRELRGSGLDACHNGEIIIFIGGLFAKFLRRVGIEILALVSDFAGTLYTCLAFFLFFILTFTFNFSHGSTGNLHLGEIVVLLSEIDF
jgi:hypothetical protein